MFRNLYESINSQNNKQGTYYPLPNANDLRGIKNFQVNYNTNLEQSIPFAGKYQFDITNETGVGSNPGHIIQNLFRSEQTLSEQDRLCKTKTLDQLISEQNNNSALRCGWLYKKEPTGKFPVPNVSIGAFGTKNGPTKSIKQPDGEWFWDLSAAKNRIHKDLCATMSSCNQLDQGYYKGKCGWCEEGRGIPISQNKRIIFPGDPLTNCNGSITTNTNKCPSFVTQSETETYIDETGQVVSNNSIGPLCDKQCMLQALNAAGCNSNGTIASALYENNNTNNYFGSIDNTPSFMAFKRNINNPRFMDNIKSGNVDKNVALSEFQQLFNKTPDSTTPLELRYAARDLCMNKGDYDKYNFCLEYTDATPNPSLTCIQREFLSQGGQYTGRYYPSTTDSIGYKTLTNNGRTTWGEVKEKIRALKNSASGVGLAMNEGFGDAKGITYPRPGSKNQAEGFANSKGVGYPSARNSGHEGFMGVKDSHKPMPGSKNQNQGFTNMSDTMIIKRNLQNTAIMNFLGGSLPALISNNKNKVELYLFKPSQQGNILWSYSLQSSDILNKPRLVGIQPNDILLILGQLKPQQNMKIKPKIKSNKLAVISINNYMWNRIRGIDSPGLFVNSSNTSIATSCTNLITQKNYFKILAGYTTDMEILYQDCNSAQDTEFKTLNIEPAQENDSPIMNFSVYERSYNVQLAQSSSDYFSTTSMNMNQNNNGLKHRFEEYRNPELFICDFKNVQINNREKFVNFNTTESLVKCITGIAPNCWKHIGFTFRINDTGVPNRTSPKSILSIGPIRCILTYTDTVQIALSNRNETVINTQPIISNTWYRIGITYSGSEMILSVLNISNYKVQALTADNLINARMVVNTNDKESLMPNNQFPNLKLGKDQFESFRGDLKYVTFYKETMVFENILKELDEKLNKGWVDMDKEIRTADFYEHCSYMGKSATLPEGQYNENVVSELLADNLLSSVKIPFGMNVKLYDEPNFNGQQLNLYMNSRCLVDSEFNDKASSLAVNDFRT